VVRARLASSNANKARELAALMPGWSLEPLDMGASPEETGASFRENALSKARHGRRIAPEADWVLGEDSGIEVRALGGAPGVRSARFAGEGASDAANNARLLAALAGIVDRSARYVCELVALAPDGRAVHGRGMLDGTVATAPAGTGGFGYDPLLVPAGESRTIAELGDEWKREHGHRAAAVRDLLERLAGGGGRPVAPDSGPAA
jgi:XTP/dITP diphosphohydrolase